MRQVPRNIRTEAERDSQQQSDEGTQDFTDCSGKVDRLTHSVEVWRRMHRGPRRSHAALFCQTANSWVGRATRLCYFVTVRATEVMFQFCVSERSSFGNAWSHALAGSALRAEGTLVGRFLRQPISACLTHRSDRASAVCSDLPRESRGTIRHRVRLVERVRNHCLHYTRASRIPLKIDQFTEEVNTTLVGFFCENVRVAEGGLLDRAGVLIFS